LQLINRDRLPGMPVPPLADPMIIGIIARPIGTNGEVKVNKTSEGCPRCLYALKSEIIVRLEDQFRKLIITAQSPTSNWVRYKFKGIDTPEDAGLLSGAEIVIPWENRPEKDKDEYYVDDLIGCTVVADDDTELGFLSEVLHFGHHDIWKVDGCFGEVLIPAVKEFIISVDVTSHLIVIRRVEGLWDEP